MTERDDFIAGLVTETAELNSATYEHLRSYATIGLPLEDIKRNEIAYFALSVTIYSLAQFAKLPDTAQTADESSIEFIWLAITSGWIEGSFGEVIKSFQQAFLVYHNALLAMDEDNVQFGVFLSRRLCGKSNHMIGITLTGFTYAILKGFSEALIDYR